MFKTKTIKINWKIISGVVSALVAGFLFLLDLNSATPSIDVPTVIVSKEKVIAVFENKSDSSISNFNTEMYLHYSDHIEKLSKKDAGALVGSSGRREVKFTEKSYKKPDRITVCVFFTGPLGFDTVWQKVELEPEFSVFSLAMHGIYPFSGGTTGVGHNYFSSAGCVTNA